MPGDMAGGRYVDTFVWCTRSGRTALLSTSTTYGVDNAYEYFYYVRVLVHMVLCSQGWASGHRVPLGFRVVLPYLRRTMQYGVLVHGVVRCDPRPPQHCVIHATVMATSRRYGILSWVAVGA